jgi:hypothetical protein
MKNFEVVWDLEIGAWVFNHGDHNGNHQGHEGYKNNTLRNTASTAVNSLSQIFAEEALGSGVLVAIKCVNRRISNDEQRTLK